MRDILTSPQIIDMQRKRRAYIMRLTILFVILFVVLVGALAYLSSYRAFTIHTITVSGTRIINKEDIEDSVRKELSGRYLYLFARSNSFIYPKQALYRDLRTQFPRINTITIADEGIHNIVITITERSGSYLYCGHDIPKVSSDIGENCYFINSDGYIFDKAPYFSGNVYFKYYALVPDSDDGPLRKQMLPPDEFHSLERFIDGISSLGFKPVSLSIDVNGLYTLYLDHKSSDTAPVILFKKDNDLSTVLDNLSLSMKKDEFANDIHSKYSTLLYIDLRFTNKVLYKFQ